MKKPILLLFLGVLFSISSLSGQTQKHLWSFGLGDGEGDNDEVTALAQHPTGDILTAGFFEGYLDFDADTGKALRSAVGQENLYLARYSPSGDLRWVSTATSSRGVEPQAIALDSSNNVYVTGFFLEEVDFTPQQPGGKIFGATSNNADAFLAKFNDSGQLLWAQALSGNSIDFGADLVVKSNQEIVLLGHFSDTLILDSAQSTTSTLISAGAGDVFLAGFNPQGQWQWATHLPGTGFDNSRALNVDAQDNLYVLGDFTATLSFNSNPLNSVVRQGGNDVFLAKYGPTGAFKWGQRLGGFSTDLAYDMDLYDSTLAIVGTFRFSAQFDPTQVAPSLSSNGGEDVFLAVYDTSGSHQWSHALGSSSNEDGNAVTITPNGEVHAGGYFIGSVDFDPSAASETRMGTGGDGYIASYDLSSGQFNQVVALRGTNFSTITTLLTTSSTEYLGAGYFVFKTDVDPSPDSTLLNTPGTNNYSSFWAGYQAGNLTNAWAMEDRTGGDDALEHLQVGSANRIYTAGTFAGEVDFDPGQGEFFLQATGASDVFLAAYDSSGSFLWAKSFGGAGTEGVKGLELNSAGELVLAGEFNQSFSFANTDSVVTTSGWGAFLLQTDAQGNLLWTQEFSGSSDEFINGLSINSADEISVVGHFRGSLEVGRNAPASQTFSASNRDGFWTELSPLGAVLNTRTFGANSNDYLYDIDHNAQDEVLLTGSFRFTVDFDFGPGSTTRTTTGSNDAFIAQYDAQGNFQWVQSWGSFGGDYAYQCAFDPAGNAYASGIFYQDVNLQPFSSDTLRSLGSADVFLLSFTGAGQYSFSQVFGGAGYDYPLSLNYSLGQVHQTGMYASQATFGRPGQRHDTLVSKGINDGFVHSVDTSGNSQNALTFGGLAADETHAFVSLGQQAYVGGSFSREIDADPEGTEVWVPSRGGKDAYLIKLGPAVPCVTVYDTLALSHCGPLFWRGKNRDSTGFYQDTLLTARGCDSVVVLDLLVQPVFMQNDTLASCSASIWRGQNVSESGFYSDTLVSSQGCDSIYSLHFTRNPSFIDSSSVSACNSYFWQGQNLNTSGTYRDTLLTSQGCDSVLVLNLTVNSSDSSVQDVTACNSYFWQGQTLSTSGIYRDTLLTSQGCDSVLVLNLTVNSSDSSLQNVTACDSYLWQGQTLSTSGTYRDTLLTAQGCDSVLVLNLTVNSSDSSLQNVTACNSYFWQGQTLNASGTYRDTLLTSLGCDSILVLQLQVDQLSDSAYMVLGTGFALDTTADRYQWVDCDAGFSPIAGANGSSYTPLTSSGNFAVILEKGACVDTSACMPLYPSNLLELKAGQVKVFPNPSRGLVNLETSGFSTQKALLKIYNAQGGLSAVIALSGREKLHFELPAAKGKYLLILEQDHKALWRNWLIKR